MIGIEKEVSEAASKMDLMRRALYNNLSACSRMSNELAETHWAEFKVLLRELRILVEDADRKYNQLRRGNSPE